MPTFTPSTSIIKSRGSFEPISQFPLTAYKHLQISSNSSIKLRVSASPACITISASLILFTRLSESFSILDVCV